LFDQHKTTTILATIRTIATSVTEKLTFCEQHRAATIKTRLLKTIATATL